MLVSQWASSLKSVRYCSFATLKFCHLRVTGINSVSIHCGETMAASENTLEK